MGDSGQIRDAPGAPTGQVPGPDQLVQVLRAPDWPVLQRVGECRFVTSDVVAMLQFPRRWGIRLAQASLNRLSRARFIATRPFSRAGEAGLNGGGLSPRCWHLTPLGLGALAAYLSVERERLPYTGYEPLMAPLEVRHRLCLSEMRGALEHYARGAGGRIEHWHAEARLGNGLIADAVFTWRCGAVVRAFAVELDRGTETLSRFAEKVQPYMNVLADRTWARYCDTQPLILTVVALPGPRGVRRLDQLRQAVAKVTGRRIMYFATAEQLYRVRPGSHGRYPDVASGWGDPVAYLNGRPDDDKRALLITEVVTNEAT